MGHVNKLMKCAMLMRHVTPKNNIPLSFLRSDWLLPEVALLTTVIIYRPEGRGSGGFFFGGGGGHLNFRRTERGSFVNHRKKFRRIQCLDNTSLKACKINASILLGKKCLQSQLVLSFTRADVPPVASPCIVVLDFPLAFLLSSCC